MLAPEFLQLGMAQADDTQSEDGYRMDNEGAVS